MQEVWYVTLDVLIVGTICFGRRTTGPRVPVDEARRLCDTQKRQTRNDDQERSDGNDWRGDDS